MAILGRKNIAHIVKVVEALTVLNALEKEAFYAVDVLGINILIATIAYKQNKVFMFVVNVLVQVIIIVLPVKAKVKKYVVLVVERKRKWIYGDNIVLAVVVKAEELINVLIVMDKNIFDAIGVRTRIIFNAVIVVEMANFIVLIATGRGISNVTLVGELANLFAAIVLVKEVFKDRGSEIFSRT